MNSKLDLMFMDRKAGFSYCSILRALGQARNLKKTAIPNAEGGGIAQLGEHLLCKQGVKGSNPFISTIWADSSAG